MKSLKRSTERKERKAGEVIALTDSERVQSALGVDLYTAQRFLRDGMTAEEARQALGVSLTAVYDMRGDRIKVKREAQHGKKQRYWYDVWSVIEEKQRREPQEVA